MIGSSQVDSSAAQVIMQRGAWSVTIAELKTRCAYR